MKIRISRDYGFFRPPLQIIVPPCFDRYGETLRDSRNRINPFECVKFAVKSYGSLRLYDLRRLGFLVPVHLYIRDRYARIEASDPGSVMLHGASNRWFFELRQRFKHQLHRWL